MILKILGSSSAGNSYILESLDGILIIECGVSHHEVSKAIDYQWQFVSGVLISHEHGDHSKSVYEFQKRGVKVYTSHATAGKLIKDHPIRVIVPNKTYNIGSFKVMPFEVKHDVYCLGFVIYHQESGEILFATDTYYIPFRVPNLNHIIIECNYDEEILNSNIENGKLPAIVRDRVRESHMSLKSTQEMLAVNDLSKVVNIVLIHLSDGNSNASKMKKVIEASTGKKVTIGDKNVVVDFNLNPF